MDKKFLSAEEAIAFFGLNPEQFQEMVDEGEVRALADRGTWKYRRDEIEGLIQEGLLQAEFPTGNLAEPISEEEIPTREIPTFDPADDEVTYLEVDEQALSEGAKSAEHTFELPSLDVFAGAVTPPAIPSTTGSPVEGFPPLPKFEVTDSQINLSQSARQAPSPEEQIVEPPAFDAEEIPVEHEEEVLELEPEEVWEVEADEEEVASFLSTSTEIPEVVDVEEVAEVDAVEEIPVAETPSEYFMKLQPGPEPVAAIDDELELVEPAAEHPLEISDFEEMLELDEADVPASPSTSTEIPEVVDVEEVAEVDAVEEIPVAETPSEYFMKLQPGPEPVASTGDESELDLPPLPKMEPTDGEGQLAPAEHQAEFDIEEPVEVADFEEILDEGVLERSPETLAEQPELSSRASAPEVTDPEAVEVTEEMAVADLSYELDQPTMFDRSRPDETTVLHDKEEAVSPEEDSAVQLIPEESAASDSDVVLAQGTDSDVALVTSHDSDVTLVKDSDSDVVLSSKSDSDVVLAEGTDSDVALASSSDSDVTLVKDSDSDVVLAKDSDSDVTLAGSTEHAVVVQDSGVSLSAEELAESASDSDVQISDSGIMLDLSDSGITLESSAAKPAAFAASPEDSGITLDIGDSGEALESPFAQSRKLKHRPDDSGVSLEPDSGISLDVDDSGISLESSATPDDSGITLDVDSGISLEKDDSGITFETIADSGISLEADDSGISLGGFDSGIRLDEQTGRPKQPAVPIKTDVELEILDEDAGDEDEHTAMIVMDEDEDEAVASSPKKKKNFAGLSGAFDSSVEVEDLEIADDLDAAELDLGAVDEEDEEVEEDILEASDEVFSGSDSLGLSEEVISSVSLERSAVRSPREPSWAVSTMIPLVVCALLLAVNAAVLWEGVSTMWTGTSPAVTGFLVDALGGGQ